MDTLALGYALPAIGRARDFHPLETCACSAHNKKRIPNGILRNSMVGDTRFELVTPAVSRQCSPPELTAHFSVVAGVHQRVDILSD